MKSAVKKGFLLLAVLLTLGACYLFYNNFIAAAGTFDNPHGNYVPSTEACGKCHSGHSSGISGILRLTTQRETCYACHGYDGGAVNIQAQFGETVIGTSVYSPFGSFHPVPSSVQLCNNCHDPHLANEASPGGTASLLAVGPSKISSGNAVCGYCHGFGSTAPGGDMVTSFTGTVHDTAITNPSSGTQIKCARCHQPHGSPFDALVRAQVVSQTGGVYDVTGNNSSLCFGCHSDTTGQYSGKSIYEQIKHGISSGTIISETTQADFSQGTLTNVAALSSGDITLSGDPGLRFDGVDDKVTLTSGYTSINNTFTYEFWAKPLATHEIDAESTSGALGTSGQKYAIGAMHGGATGKAGVGVSIGTNGISVYEHADSYMPALLAYSGTINNWVHIAVVYNNKTPSLYINGQLVKTGQTSPKIPYPSQRFGWGDYGYYNGSLDDIRLWNYARTQTQIQSDMYTQLAGNESGLIGYWKFNEGSGTTVTDSTGTNNGTTTGGPVWNSYSASGNRVSPECNLPANTATGSQIQWNAYTPSSTTLTVDTNVFLSGAWQGWQAVTNGGTIPGISNGTNLTGGKIQYRANLSTSNTTVTPWFQDIDININHNSTVANTAYPGTGYQSSLCLNCHEPHGKTGLTNYLRATGNNLCYGCHVDSMIPAQYSYRGTAAYNSTPHAAGTVAGLGYPAGDCLNCHAVHGKDNGSGSAFPKQLRLANENVCFGGAAGACHDSSSNSARGINIKNRFTAGSNRSARHSITAAEQSAGSTKVDCVNCHDPHLNNASSKVIDPTNRYTAYTLTKGFENYVHSDTGAVYLMVKAKHDGVAPTVNDASITISNMTATGCRIEWTTNEYSSCIVEYGLTDAYGSQVTATALNSGYTQFRADLTGLTQGQNYHFRIKATDRVGNYGYSADRVLDSTAPTITVAPALSGATGTSVTIVWTTNESSTSYVDINTTPEYPTYKFVYGNNSLVTSHSVTVTDLTGGVEYKYRVRSTDARGNTVTGSDLTFTLTAPPPTPTVIAEPDILNYSYDASVTLECNAIADPNPPTQYYFEVSTASNFSSIYYNSGWVNNTNCTLTVSNYYAVTYYWRVKARNTYQIESNWSSTDDFVHNGGDEPKWDSCPFIYTWNGTEYEYLSDMSGPVLNLPKHVKVDPNKRLPYYLPAGNLVPDVNNQYLVKIRSNALGEIDILDQIGLILVDHLPGYEIISSTGESPGPSMKGNHPKKLYAISKNALPVKKAVDKHGQDVTRQLLKQDNIPAPAERVNFAESSQYILDFGKLQHPEYAKLVLDGWTYFKKEINLKPKDIPRVEVINQKGQWEKVRNIGFVSGDKKSMLVDLSGAFKTDDHRVRIFIGERDRRFVLDRVRMDQSPPIPLKTTYVPASYADLHFRGPANQFGTTFDHPVQTKDDVKAGDINYIFYGKFTKYGDVGELLAKRDDMFVIMQHGDEVLVKFDNPPLPNGLERTPVLLADFYYKQTGRAVFDATVKIPVDPLPFHKMTRYPYQLPEKYPDDEAHQKYQKEWLTREYVLVDGKVVPAESVKKSLWSRFTGFFGDLWNRFVEFLKSVFAGEETTISDNDSLTSESGGGENVVPSGEITEKQLGIQAEKQEEIPAEIKAQLVYGKQKSKVQHYSLNTNYIILQPDNGTSSVRYDVNSPGVEIYQSSSEPNPSSPGSDASAQKSKVLTDDSIRWTTDYYAPNTNDGSYNYQMFKFVISDPKLKLVGFKILWKGYGEPTGSYKTTLSLWNFNTSGWDAIYDTVIGSEVSLNLAKYEDFQPYCYKCHAGTVPSGVQLGTITRNISASYPTDAHGGGSSTDGTGTTIKVPYGRGNSALPCADCHDLHGSQNAYHLRENTNLQVGNSVPDMSVTGPTDTSKNAATLTYCQSCHTGSLYDYHKMCLDCHRGSGGAHEGYDDSAPKPDDFGRSCISCHTHGGYMPAHGDCHCNLNFNAKAF